MGKRKAYYLPSRIPMPNENLGDKRVVASVWLRDDPEDGPEGCLVMTLNKEAPFYTVIELEWHKGSWTVVDDEDFPNINPATEAFAALGGDY